MVGPFNLEICFFQFEKFVLNYLMDDLLPLFWNAYY